MNDFSACKATSFKSRFRGFLPIIIDIETAGINPATDALLEIAAVFLSMDNSGVISTTNTVAYHVEPFEGANLDQKSLDFLNIDPYHPFRFALPEKEALTLLFEKIQQAIKKAHCQRAILVGHNAWFDLLFIKEACDRCQIKSPFHSFTCLDTATLGALIYGQTVLAKALQAAEIEFDAKQAHSAIYDAEKTAELFCLMINQWRQKNTACAQQ